MSQTRDQKRFTILEVSADWHDLVIPQRTMRPSIARVREQIEWRKRILQQRILQLYKLYKRLILLSK